MRPTITITMPVYNGERFLERAIASALAQADPPDEILVIDDHSQDSSSTIVKDYLSSSFRYLRNDVNVGIAKNWNRCLQQATGDFVMFLHQDDELFPDAVRLTRQVLSDHPQVDHVFGQVWHYDGARAFPGPGEQFGLLSAKEYFLRSCGSFYEWDSGSTTRRDLALQIGGYDETTRHVTDVDFWIRLGLQLGAAYAIDAPIATFRVHQGNLHKRLNTEDVADWEYLTLLRKIAQTFEIPAHLRPSAMRALFPVLSRSVTAALRQGRLDHARALATQTQALVQELDGSLISAASAPSRLLLRLTRESALGAGLAWLLVRIWELGRNAGLGLTRPAPSEYTLEQLIERVQRCG
ncbi:MULTISPECIES: glycosyltransferase [unclassified Thiocapsa]|uniref:glycosyltransferase n=1 Tax=unclassified Thiocapsa TaxID=2641286 RepID=UPI0035B0EB17